jgi:hypothetical protein
MELALLTDRQDSAFSDLCEKEPGRLARGMQCGQTDTGVFKSWLVSAANRLAGYTRIHDAHENDLEDMSGR